MGLQMPYKLKGRRMVKILNENNFKQETSSGTILVDFYADWCGPCKRMAPTLNELAAEFGDKIKIAKVNVDQSKSLAQDFGVRGIPMFVVIKDGQVINTTTGAKSKQQLMEFCNIG